MRTSVIATLVGAVLLQTAAGDCHLTDTEFIKQLSTMKDWPTIYAVFKRNLPACPDDGFYAEGYSDVIVAALANRWSDLPTLNKLLAQDKALQSFVYRHINATTDINDLRRALSNATTKCPSGATSLCNELATRCRSAIAEMP
jgi:hypothetical protein